MKKLLKRLMSILLASCIVNPVFTGPVNAEEHFEAGDAVGPIVLDGRLDENDWMQAPESSPFVWLASRAKSYPPAKTTFKVLADTEAVYFGITCEEPKMDQLKAEPQERDTNGIFTQDVVEIFLDPEGKGFNYYQFAVTANNDQWDGYFIEGGNTSGGYYSSVWESAVYKGENYWSVEVRIPLYAFAHTPLSDFSESWLCNVARERKPEPELTTWSPLQEKFHEPARFQKIDGMPLKPAKYDLIMRNLSAYVLNEDEENYTGEINIEFAEHLTGVNEYKLTLSDAAGNVLIDNQNVTIPAQGGTVTFDNVVFTAMGRNLFKVVLQDSQGQTVHALYWETWVKFEPEIIIEVSEPFYRNNIYPGQEIKKVSGKVILHEKFVDGEGKHVKVSLSGPGFSQEKKIKIKDSEVSFDIPANKLVVGDYILKATVINNKDKELASEETIIRKLPQPEGSWVYIDSSLNMVVNGEPLFAKGWYSDEKYLVSHELLQNTPHPNSEYVNIWHGEVMAQPERLVPAEVAQMKTDVEPSETVYAALLAVINENRTNPDIRYYYVADEPELRDISPVYMKYVYQFLKENDPYHPVMIITRNPELYTECADILNPHPYLNPRIENGVRTMRDPVMIRDLMKRVLSAGRSRIPAWFTPQAFSYEFKDLAADYPTFTEFRMMVYTAIANGAKGLTPFIYYDHFNSPDLRMGIDFIYETLAGMENFLLSDEVVPVSVNTQDVDVLVKKDGHELLVIAVNISNRQLEAQIQSKEFKKFKKLYGYREEGVFALDKDELTLEFQPYQVHLLASVPVGTGMKTVEEFMEELAAVNAALAKPGNILYGRGREIEWNASDTYTAITNSLTNGVTDALGWRDVRSQVKPPWVEAKFTTFTPEFNRAKIYTSTVEDLEFWIWENGDWKLAAMVTGNQQPVIVLDFIERISTERIRLVMPKTHPKTKAELYEIELYDEPSDFEVESIIFNPDAVSLRVGDTERISATVYDQYGYTLHGVRLNWSSEDPSIASVDQDGLVTGISGGETVIRAEFEGMSASVTVKVDDNLLKNGDFNLNSDYWYLVKDCAVWSPDEGVDNSGCLKLQGGFFSALSNPIKVNPNTRLTLTVTARGVSDAVLNFGYYYRDKEGKNLGNASTNLNAATTAEYNTYTVDFTVPDNSEIDYIELIIYNKNGLNDPDDILWVDNVVLKVNDNLLQNGNFNLNSNNWYLVNGCAVWSPDEGVDNSGCLKLQGGFFSALSNPIKVNPNTRLTLTATARGVSDAVLNFGYYYRDKEGKNLGNASTNLNAATTADYNTYTVDFTVPDNSEIDYIELIIYNKNGLNDPDDILWVDDVVLKLKQE